MTTEMRRKDLQSSKARNSLNTEKHKAVIYLASEQTKSHGLAGHQDTIIGATVMYGATFGTY